MKKISIRTVIILPVVTLMLILPFVTYLSFGQLIERYVKNQSYNDMVQAANTVINAANTNSFLYFDAKGSGEKDAASKEQIKEFASIIKEMIKARKFNVRVLVVNSKYKVTFPADAYSNDYEIIDYFQNNQIDISPTEKFSSKNIKEVSTDSGNSLAIACDLGKYEKIRARYVIFYHPIENIAQIKRSAAKIAFWITALISALTIIILYLISNRIVHPLKALRKAAEKIGSGDFVHTDVKSGICEISEISTAIDSMSVQLAKSDLEQKTFFQNASHELRTPLMSIRGYAEGIECGLFKDDREAGKVILRECARLSSLIEDILSLSRLDNRRQEIDIQKIDIYAFVNGCLKRFEAIATKKNIKLELIGIEGRFFAQADESLLSKIFDNLISNAIRYAKSKISMSICEKEKRIIVMIENDGVPIAESDLEKIFIRFYKGAGGNFGIGLSVAKACAQYMGGSLRAIKSDCGAVFETTLIKSDK